MWLMRGRSSPNSSAASHAHPRSERQHDDVVHHSANNSQSPSGFCHRRGNRPRVRVREVMADVVGKANRLHLPPVRIGEIDNHKDGRPISMLDEVGGEFADGQLVIAHERRGRTKSFQRRTGKRASSTAGTSRAFVRPGVIADRTRTRGKQRR